MIALPIMALRATEPLKVGEKFSPQSVGPWSMDDLRRYAAASGDDNPIHLDAALARRAGLPALPCMACC